MATAMQETSKNKSQANGDASSHSRGGLFQVHKPGEGYATRLGAFVVALLFVAYTCHHWYYGWTFIRNVLDRILKILSPKILAWAFDPGWMKVVALGGTVLLLAGGGLLAFHLIYVRLRTAEFLVKTDGELAKVTWPKITPWFKPNTQVWGATYVVIIVLVVLTIYIMIVDYVFLFLHKVLFL